MRPPPHPSRFRQCRVGMDRERDIFERCAHLDRKAKLRDHVGSFYAGDLRAENETRIVIVDQFQRSLRLRSATLRVH